MAGSNWNSVKLITSGIFESEWGVFGALEELMSAPEFRGCPFINAAAEYAEEGNPVQQESAEFYAEFRNVLAKLVRQAGIIDAEQLAAQMTILIAGTIVSEQIQRNSGTMRSAYNAAEKLVDSYLIDVKGS